MAGLEEAAGQDGQGGARDAGAPPRFRAEDDR